VNADIAATSVDLLHLEYVVAEKIGAGVAAVPVDRIEVKGEAVETGQAAHVGVRLDFDLSGVVDPGPLTAGNDGGRFAGVFHGEIEPRRVQSGSQAAPVAEQMLHGRFAGGVSRISGRSRRRGRRLIGVDNAARRERQRKRSQDPQTGRDPRP